MKTIIRAPNHLGDLVMALPALLAARADVQVVSGLAPLLVLSGLPGRTLAFERGRRGFLDAAAQLRRGAYHRGVLLTPSFSSALLLRAGGVAHRRGTATDRRRLLLTERVAAQDLAGLHRSEQYMVLATRKRPAERPVPRLEVPAALTHRWRTLLGDADAPTIGLFPGSNAESRRWDPARFAETARQLTEQDARVVVFGGPQERLLTAEVAGRVAIDMGGRTDLPLLAAGLADCALLITNDSGPMHLAAAVGTRTVSLWGPGDPAVTGPPRGHVLLRHPELGCVPCVRNRCPRHGPGDMLPEAHRECMQLISVGEVVNTVTGFREPVDGFRAPAETEGETTS